MNRPPILYKLAERAIRPTINLDGSITVHALDDTVLDPGRIVKIPTGLGFVSRDEIRRSTVLSLDCEFRNHDLPFIMMPGTYPMLGQEIKIAVFSMHATRVLVPFGTPLAKMLVLDAYPIRWEQVEVMDVVEDVETAPSAIPMEETFSRWR